MANNKPKKEITETMKKDYVTNKLLLVFTFAFALLLFFANIGRMMKNITTFMLSWNITKVVACVGAGLFVVGIIMLIVEKVKGINTKYRLLSGKNISVVSAVIAISAAALSFIFSPEMLTLLYIFIPALVVLYIVYYSYQREFFMVALVSILSGVSIWLLMSDLVNSGDKFIFVVAEILLVLLTVVTIVANVRGGKLSFFGREVALFKADAKYALVYIAHALSILLLAAALFFPTLAIYFIFALVAYILITGIYFTVKLI